MIRHFRDSSCQANFHTTSTSTTASLFYVFSTYICESAILPRIWNLDLDPKTKRSHREPKQIETLRSNNCVVQARNLRVLDTVLTCAILQNSQVAIAPQFRLFALNALSQTPLRVTVVLFGCMLTFCSFFSLQLWKLLCGLWLRDITLARGDHPQHKVWIILGP